MVIPKTVRSILSDIYICDLILENSPWVGGLTLPIDTANQVVYPAGQTDTHSNP